MSWWRQHGEPTRGPSGALTEVALALALGVLSVTQMFLLIAAQWYVVVTLGPGVETDALFAGMAVPQIVLAVLGGSIVSVVVPLLAESDVESFREDAWALVLAVLTVLAVLGGLLGWFAPWWAPRIAPGLSTSGAGLLVAVTRIHLFGMALTGVISVLSSCFHARRRFIWAETTPVLSGLAGLVMLLWALPRYGVEGAAWSAAFRGAVNVALLAPILGGLRRPAWRGRVMLEAWRRIRPLLVGAAYYKLDVVLDRFLSSLAPAGGLSLFYLGQQVYDVGHGVIGKAAVAPMVPALAVEARAHAWQRFRNILRRRLIIVAGASATCYLGVAVVGWPLLRLLIGYGGITEQTITNLWVILLCLGGTFVGGSLGNVLASAFYARGDTVTPTRFGVVVFTVGAAMKVAGFFWYGLIGLALAASAYFGLAALGLYVLLQRQLAGHRG